MTHTKEIMLSGSNALLCPFSDISRYINSQRCSRIQVKEFPRARNLKELRLTLGLNSPSRASPGSASSIQARFGKQDISSVRNTMILEGAHRKPLVVDDVPAVLRPRPLQPRKNLFVFGLRADVQRRFSSLVSLRSVRSFVVWRHHRWGSLRRSPTTAAISTDSPFLPRTGGTLLLLLAPFPFPLPTLATYPLFASGSFTTVRGRRCCALCFRRRW